MTGGGGGGPFGPAVNTLTRRERQAPPAAVQVDPRAVRFDQLAANIFARCIAGAYGYQGACEIAIHGAQYLLDELRGYDPITGEPKGLPVDELAGDDAP
jgi:hypothetical protein